ncbi:MAG: hypothetical protein FWF01_00695 [Alphaproteobacteria bacterium]|nr:hypothetical protein [Alphaproteobacteria bacterium]
MKYKAPAIIAHRGASGDAPENTLAAFGLAKRVGAHGVELDTHLSADGEIVVIHDYTLNRTARLPSGALLQSQASVADLTLGQLQCYDVGVWFSTAYAGEKIPTLEQAMDLIGPDMLLDIEIKADKGKPFRELALAMADFLHGYSKKHPVDNVMVSSFNPLALRAFAARARQLNLKVPTGLLYGKESDVPWYLRRGEGRIAHNPDFMIPYFANLLDKRSLSAIGLFRKRPVFTYTVNDMEIAKRLAQKNISGIITNYPEKMLALNLRRPHAGRG